LDLTGLTDRELHWSALFFFCLRDQASIQLFSAVPSVRRN
jgi:hypothetical protein